MSKKYTKIHLNILDKKRKEIYYKLFIYKKYGYLAGGTALALQINHRHSYDFDIFCYKPISNYLLRKIKKDFKIKQVLVNNSDEFSFLDKGDVKITFLYYPFKFKRGFIETKDSLSLLNVLNIAASKAYALNRRGEYRDYVDIYFIIKNKKASLKKIIKKAQVVYGDIFSDKLFLSQLVYTEDLDQGPVRSVKYIGNKINSSEIFKFFKKEIKNIKLN